MGDVGAERALLYNGWYGFLQKVTKKTKKHTILVKKDTFFMKECSQWPLRQLASGT